MRVISESPANWLIARRRKRARRFMGTEAPLRGNVNCVATRIRNTSCTACAFFSFSFSCKESRRHAACSIESLRLSRQSIGNYISSIVRQPPVTSTCNEPTIERSIQGRYNKRHAFITGDCNFAINIEFTAISDSISRKIAYPRSSVNTFIWGITR